jgi:hypothetical protein
VRFQVYMSFQVRAPVFRGNRHNSVTEDRGSVYACWEAPGRAAAIWVGGKAHGSVSGPESGVTG